MTVTFCSGSLYPVAFRNVDFVRPIARARSFINRAKFSSVPETPSAMVMAASLPDWITRPRSRSSSRMALLTLANIADPPDPAPPFFQALTETVNSLSMVSRPFFNSLKTTSAVMILAILAGATSSSAFFSKRTARVSASTKIAVGAMVWNACAPASDAAPLARTIASPHARRGNERNANDFADIPNSSLRRAQISSIFSARRRHASSPATQSFVSVR